MKQLEEKAHYSIINEDRKLEYEGKCFLFTK